MVETRGVLNMNGALNFFDILAKCLDYELEIVILFSILQMMMFSLVRVHAPRFRSLLDPLRPEGRLGVDVKALPPRPSPCVLPLPKAR